MSRIRNHPLPKPDKRGRVRPHVGVRLDGSKARIDVGNIKTDGTAEMERRLRLIRQLYERLSERTAEIQRREGMPENAAWTKWAFEIAKRIGRGEQVTDAFVSDQFSSPVESPTYTATTVAGVITQLRSWGIPVVEGDSYQQGLINNHQQIEQLVAETVQRQLADLRSQRGAIVDQIALPDPMNLVEAATFHDAIDAFSKYLKDTGKKNSEGKLTNTIYTKIDLAQSMKRRYEDFPLRHLTLPKWEELIAYWRNRPLTKRNTRGKKGWCEDGIKLLFKMIRWLDTNPHFKWKKPNGFEDVDRKIIVLPEDQLPEVFQTIRKKTYSPEQLAIIMGHVDGYWKAIIALCVNCAFGQSEIGQWRTSHVVLRTPHPHAEKINWNTSTNDSWVVGPRPKTGTYGEHLLWSEVADSIEPHLRDREFVFVNGEENPMWMTHAKRPQSQIDNRWTNLIKRIQKDDPDFPALPFGSLRDVLPDVLRREYSDDIASLALQHGTYSEDKLLKCYANFPFARLFEKTVELRDHFQPMLDALARP